MTGPDGLRRGCFLVAFGRWFGVVCQKCTRPRAGHVRQLHRGWAVSGRTGGGQIGSGKLRRGSELTPGSLPLPARRLAWLIDFTELLAS
jgi:hypothetical protein